MKCTWKECDLEAEFEQVAKDEEVWANLCRGHHNELENAMSKFNPKTLLRAWVLAMGGASAATKRMMK